jgi:HTH-type transcriptional regulator/antitoxin HipB
VAERADVTREWVARLENGASTVTVHRLLRVLRELELTVSVTETDRAD